MEEYKVEKRDNQFYETTEHIHPFVYHSGMVDMTFYRWAVRDCDLPNSEIRAVEVEYFLNHCEDEFRRSVMFANIRTPEWEALRQVKTVKKEKQYFTYTQLDLFEPVEQSH